MIKSYFGINFDAIVIASLFSLIFFFIIYKFKIVDFIADKIIYPMVIFLINIYNFFDNLFKNEQISTKKKKVEEKNKNIDKIKSVINRFILSISDWFSKGIIWKFIFIIYIPFLFINYLFISKITKQKILPLNTDNILDSFGSMLGAIFVASILSFLLAPSMEIKFKKSFPLACLFFFSIGIIHYFFVEN
jgi:hypothetical protein